MSRFSLIFDTSDSSNALFGAPLDAINSNARRSRYNISRGQEILVLRSANAKRDNNTAASECSLSATTMLWGFTPHWIHGPNPALQPLTIADNKVTQPYFREAFQQRRCLIPASGFYAWQGWENGPAAPYYVHMRNYEAFLMAAVWDTCEGIDRVAMITTAANSLVLPIHERMPAIIPLAQVDAWLHGANPQRLLQPYAIDAMEIHQVSHKIFAARNEDASLIEPVSSASTNRSANRRGRLARIDQLAYAPQ